jgi:GntR family transcriptional regulator, trigonelline degradation regulator
MKTETLDLVAAPLRKQVIRRLHDAIVGLEYAPGERLVERELCERYGVSRTVIREALRHLEAEGLVSLVANRGPVVSSTSYEDARALYEVRAALESLAARFAAERGTRAQKKRIARSLERVAAAYEKGVLIDQLSAKDDFYREICESASNPVIASMLSNIQARVQVLRGLSLQVPGRSAESLAELEELVAAIDRGDADTAADLATKHVERAATIALGLLHDEHHRATLNPS